MIRVNSDMAITVKKIQSGVDGFLLLVMDDIEPIYSEIKVDINLFLKYSALAN